MVEDPEGLVRSIAPQLGQGQRPNVFDRQVTLAHHPVPDLDGVEHPRPGGVREERGRWRDTDVVGGRQPLRPVQEHPIGCQVQVTRHDESEWRTGSEIEAQPLDAGDSGQVDISRKCQRGGVDPVVVGHDVVAHPPDPREEAYEPPALQHPGGDSERRGLLMSEGADEEFLGHGVHGSHLSRLRGRAGVALPRPVDRPRGTSGVHARWPLSGDSATERWWKRVARSPLPPPTLTVSLSQSPA